MTNFDILKNEISKTNNPEEFQSVMDEFRWGLFSCEPNEGCIKDFSCKKCYEIWLMKEI